MAYKSSTFFHCYSIYLLDKFTIFSEVCYIVVIRLTHLDMLNKLVYGIIYRSYFIIKYFLRIYLTLCFLKILSTFIRDHHSFKLKNNTLFMRYFTFILCILCFNFRLSCRDHILFLQQFKIARKVFFLR